MRGALDNLYWLLTYRVVWPRTAAWRAVVVLSVLTLLAPFDAQLADVGLSRVKLAVVCSLVVIVWFNLGGARSYRMDQYETLFVFSGTIMIILAVFATLLFVGSDRWVQHGVSVYYLFGGCFKLASSLFGEDTLKDIDFSFRDWRVGSINAVRWMAVFALAQCLFNELALRALSPNEWIVVFALAPIAFHYLTDRTIIATHPYEDDDS